NANSIGGGDMKQGEAIKKIIDEYGSAAEKFQGFHSRHEGYAVIKEELDELWDNIKADATEDLIIEEAVQVGAMVLRFLIDITE
ncbi:unnamed protein product, partial [marine sediment metagenome]